MIRRAGGFLLLYQEEKQRKEQAEKAANKLIALGWLHSDSSRAGTTAGRKRTTYYVNPEVYELAENY